MVRRVCIFTLAIVVIVSGNIWTRETVADDPRQTPLVVAIEKAQPAIAAIYVRKGQSRGSGSGSVIDPRGYVLTAEHVVGDDHIVLLHGRAPVQAKLVGTLVEYDLALLKLGGKAFNRPASPRYPLDGQPLEFVPLGIAEELRLGEDIINMGNPGGRGIVVTRGIISSLGIHGGGGALSMATQSSNGWNQKLQFDASNNPGNSGGALINMLGQQVGLATSSIRDEEGTHFAVPLNYIRGGIFQMLNSELRHRFVTGISVDSAVNEIIATVQPDSPAWKAGLRDSDQIVRCNGRRLRDPIDWEFTRDEFSAGKPVALGIERDGTEVEITFVPTKRESRPAIDVNDPQPGLLCRTARYDENIGEPLSDEIWPTGPPRVVPQVTAKPEGISYSDHYEVVIEGMLKIETAGSYRVGIKSDDGSKLFVHGNLVVDNDGNHARQIRTGWVDLDAGLHPIRIEYYEDEGDETLGLLMADAEGEFVSVKPELLYHVESKTTPATDSK